MTDDRSKKAEAIFQKAADMDPAERELYVDDACRDDPGLRDDVITLLSYLPDDAGDDFLDQPAVRIGAPSKRVTDPDRIGPYRVIRRLGEGAYGVVYEVEQSEPIRRRLALKLLKPGMDTEEVLDRFETERQTLALMDHANIARVVDAGASKEGRPFFVMELVAGDPITQYCDRASMTLRERLELMITVCEAVQHAHQRGVLHRDIKPSNVLVTLVDGRPVPKVIDFGIAKVMVAPTGSGPVPMSVAPGLGTPVYMSPEQASASRLDVDTATDVYSLGVLCYELLTGHYPYDPEEINGVPPEQYEATIIRLAAAPPSSHFKDKSQQGNVEIARNRGTDPWRLGATLRNDLDCILMKAIEKDRLRRYATVHDFVLEFERYFRDEPVLAGPSTTRYRMRKFVRRHRGGILLAGAVAVALVGSGIGLTWALLESNSQKTQAEMAHLESDAVLDFLSGMLASVAPGEEGRDVTVKRVLDIATRNVGLDFDQQPLVEARLRLVMGQAYRELGEYDAAEEHIGRSLRLHVIDLGEKDARTITARLQLGLLERARGEYARGEVTIKEVLSARHDLLGPDHRDTIEAIKELGDLYILWDKGDAVGTLEEGVALAHASLPPEDGVRADVSASLGVAYLQKGEFDKAEPLLVASVEYDARYRGPENASTLAAMQSLASLYREMGRYGESEPLYRESYEGAVEVYGPTHPETLRMRSNLALLLSDMKKYNEAYPHSSEVARAREETLGPDNPSTLVSRLNLALLLMRMGRYEESVESARVTSMRLHRAVGPDHLYTVTMDAILGRSLHLDGQLVEGESTLRRTTERARAVLPEGHWRLGRQLMYYGSCLTDMDRFEDAQRVLLESYDILEASQGLEHTRTKECIAELERLYLRWNKPDDARKWAGRLDA